MQKKGGKEKQKSLRQDHQGGEKSSKAIHDVPFDLTVEILSRLPVKTLARFRCVSKLWSSSIITESIKTRYLTQPRQLVIFYNSSCMSSCTYPLNTNTRFVVADIGSRCTLLQYRYNRSYGYVRGLICYYSNSKQFAIYNPTTRQNVLLPRIVVYHKENKAFDGFSRYDPVEKAYIVESKYYNGFFGYDPVKNQYKVLRFIEGARICEYSCTVLTFRGGPNKQEWRKIKIQADISPPRSNGVCINGIIYYLGGTLISGVLVLGRFDVRFETFDHIQMPIAVEMNQLEELGLVNYQGKLGCTFYSKDRAEVWIMKDHHSSEKNEWSKVTIAMSLPDTLNTRIAGVTLKGEIVIMPKTLDSAQTLLYAYFYDPKENKTRRVEFETNLKGEQGLCILSEPDHMENTMSLFGSQFNKKKKKRKRNKKKKSATTTVFSSNKIFMCPKTLLVIGFLCAALVMATIVRTWLISLLDSFH
ncbi:unnamed protein product [Eruca vesicaria subsp. sativa]|uniref:F-box domain-containing protein n=1 Tax=Eruca vesicaria subsp. sativa TaxID=29727 RepID=A0ABC8JY94_ERUVS|nr:unnamed protein product [Eruca vesicaria subsp. sativa]